MPLKDQGHTGSPAGLEEVLRHIQHFNQLTPAEAERLAILAEECAEVIQVVGKILRHGYESHHPDDVCQKSNRELLETEIGHVQAVKEMMQDARDVNTSSIVNAKCEKLGRINRYLHHGRA